MQKIIEILDSKTRQKEYQIDELLGLNINKNEHIAVVGANGSGKSIFINILIGAYPMCGFGVRYNFEGKHCAKAYKNIKYISFKDSYGGSEDADYYYQQRWNCHDIEGRTKVIDILGDIQNSEIKDKLYTLFNIEDILNKQLLLLSSGEMRKFQITKALLQSPKLLILENPYIGLDAPSRQMLNNLLSEIIASKNIQIMLVLSRESEIPDFITHTIAFDNRTCKGKLSIDEYKKSNIQQSCDKNDFSKNIELINQLKFDTTADTDIVQMNNVNIKYGEKQILKDINFTIKQGEKWALQGSNGSGKSTLLSLICADNPQSYACDISLFGRKRGTGESIWDIKKHIGYVSPEMQRSYLKNIPSVDIVASGLYDTIGLYQKIKPEQRAISLYWMKVFCIEHLAEQSFLKLSSGEQRMILLARAFVKSPKLLILDEPLHGLDDHNRKLAVAIIEAYTKNANITAIIVTHYAEELPNTITNNLVLNKGNIIKLTANAG